MPYPGAKNSPHLANTLINLMPPHRLYAEPFAGSGAILFRKRPAAVNVGIDADSRAPILALRPGSPRYESLCRNNCQFFCDLEALLAARPTLPELAAPAAAGAFDRDVMAARVVRGKFILLPAQRHTEPPPAWLFACCDGIEFLERFVLEPPDLVYCDPPYLLSSRRNGKRLYRREMTVADHERLLEALSKLTCMAILSGYHSKLYGARLRHWNRTAVPCTTHGGATTEWLWFNFDPPKELHDYRFLGKDHRERLRIKRKIARWLGKLNREPPVERQAILAAIAEALHAGNGSDAGGNATNGDGGPRRRK